MSLDSANRYLKGYEDGYSAAISDALKLFKMKNIDYETEISYLSIAVVDRGRDRVEEFKQIAKDLGIEP